MENSYAHNDVCNHYTHEKIKKIKSQVKKNMTSAMNEIRMIQDPVTLFQKMKFGEIGFNPMDSCPENLIEQINQSFTILMSLYAAEKYFPEAASFQFAFAFSSGRDMIVYNREGKTIAEVEIFTAVDASNNQKLRRDVNRLRDACIAAECRRVVCYSARSECRLRYKPEDKTVEVQFCPLNVFIEWINK